MSNDSGFGKGLVWLTIGGLIGGLVVGSLTWNSQTNTPTSNSTSPSTSTAQQNPPAVVKPGTAPVTATPTKTSVGDSGSAPVVVINGEPITLREVEDTLLSQEGVLQLMDMLEKQFNATKWKTLSDSDVVVQTATWRLTRGSLAAQLLQSKASEAREDLIGIALVRQALAKAGVVIDEAVITNEVKRMEKRHYEALEARKQPYMEFKSFIEQTQKMPFDEYIHQDGFKMGAGIRILVQQAASKTLTEEYLKAYMAEHINRYRVQPAVDVSAIYIPYQKAKGPGGKEIIAEEEKIRLYSVMQSLHKSISNRTMTFERTFQIYGKVYEQHADPYGRLGFVNRDGTRAIKGSRRIASRAMDEAFAVQPPYPVLLAPMISDDGMELLLVHSRRAGKEVDFAEIRERLVSDIVDAELADRTKRTIEDIRRAAVIDYRSLPPLIDQRVKDAGLPTGDLPPLPEATTP